MFRAFFSFPFPIYSTPSLLFFYFLFAEEFLVLTPGKFLRRLQKHFVSDWKFKEKKEKNKSTAIFIMIPTLHLVWCLKVYLQ